MSVLTADSRLLNRPVRAVHVDDDEEARDDLRKALPENEWQLRYLRSVEDLDTLPHDFPVDLFILDCTFGSEDRTRELVKRVTERWPDTKVVFLTSYMAPTSRESLQNKYPVLSKSELRDDPAAIAGKLTEALGGRDRADTPSAHDSGVTAGPSRPPAGGLFSSGSAASAPRQRRGLDAGAGDSGVELYRIQGSVVCPSPPDIEVLIEEPQPGAAGVKRVSVLMDFELFAAVGILERGMQFVFRTVRCGNQLISEVIPVGRDDDLFADGAADPTMSMLLEEERRMVNQLLGGRHVPPRHP